MGVTGVVRVSDVCGSAVTVGLSGTIVGGIVGSGIWTGGGTATLDGFDVLVLDEDVLVRDDEAVDPPREAPDLSHIVK